jgi:1-acyl-sn-glycerol-3-phosphate acyltransferase
MKSNEKKVIYYSDENNDDFAGTNIKTKQIDENYKYVHKNPIWRFFEFIAYYIIAIPLVWLFMRVILRVKFINKKAVKAYKKQPYFMYGNHTGFIDAFTPNLISMPRKNMIVVGPDTVSIKGIKTFVEMLGAIPTPSNVKSAKNFMKAVERHHKTRNITIYPEAHIWPYFTGVRAFPDTSFSYPAKTNAPVFAFFTAYTKPKGFLSFLRKANITIYISDPIFADENLTVSERKKQLRDKVYAFMQEQSTLSDYEVIKYVKRAENTENSDTYAQSC